MGETTTHPAGETATTERYIDREEWERYGNVVLFFKARYRAADHSRLYRVPARVEVAAPLGGLNGATSDT